MVKLVLTVLEFPNPVEISTVFSAIGTGVQRMTVHP